MRLLRIACIIRAVRRLGAVFCMLVGCGFGDNTGGGAPDGNPPPGDGAAVCGNAVVETGETCDDNNPFSNDGCSGTCQRELIVFSEYVEGTSNNKAIELHDPGAEPIDLAASTCELHVYFNGGTSPLTFALTGTLDPDGVLVVCHTSAGAPLLPHCSLLSDVMNWNGDDAVELVCHGATLDVFGQIGLDPGVGWSDAGGTISTVDTTLRRACSIAEGDPDGSDPFVLDGWTGSPTDTFDDLGLPSCTN